LDAIGLQCNSLLDYQLAPVADDVAARQHGARTPERTALPLQPSIRSSSYLP